MNVANISTSPVASVPESASLTEAVKLMRKFHVGDIVVVDGEGEKAKPVGIVTDRDIVIEVLAAEEKIDRLTVGDVMSRDVLTIQGNASIFEAAQLMENEGVRRLPVVDQYGNLKGVIAADDIYTYISAIAQCLSRISRHQRTWEAALRK